MKNSKWNKRFYLYFLIPALILIYPVSKWFMDSIEHIEISNMLQRPIYATDLRDGDIIFWKDTIKNDRAGHVAVVSFASPNINELRIAHATDNPKYYAFVETHILPSEKIKTFHKSYYVVRIKNEKIRIQFLHLIKNWLDLKPIFNAANESLMNMWDDSMAKYSTNFKLKLQREIFLENNNQKINLELPSKEGYMCSEIIILALQNAYAITNSKLYRLPSSLKLDPILCPPSTMMLSLASDSINFQVIGELII